MQTTKAIEYRTFPYGKIATIPVGVQLTPATNHPDGGWWALPWEGMTDRELSWHRGYGFHIRKEDLHRKD